MTFLALPSHWPRQMIQGRQTTVMRRTHIKDEHCVRPSYCFSDDYQQVPCTIGRVTIDVLSDDVLMRIIQHIFGFYRQKSRDDYAIYSWRDKHAFKLVHVCQRWRNIVFAWPNHLDVQVDCNSVIAIARALDVWPALPISVQSTLGRRSRDANNIIAALEQRERIAGIDFIDLSGPQLENCAELMQGPFPILRTLTLGCDAEIPPVISDTFLGGSAHHLREVNLYNVPFPALPRLLLSAHSLVELHIENIPSTGYISPEEIATCLAVSTRLRSLIIDFQSSRSFPQNQSNQHPPPMTHAVLPHLTTFVFSGVSEYLEDLMARIDVPILNNLHLQFFRWPIIGIPQLPQIIHRNENLKLAFTMPAMVHFYKDSIGISLSFPDNGSLRLDFQCAGLDNQLSLLKELYPQCSPLLSHINHLELFDHKMQTEHSTLWLEFLRPFNAVETLGFWEPDSLKQVARVLGELSEERAAEVLPMLDTIIFFTMTIWDGVEPSSTPLLQPFIDARQLSGHPVVMH